jgi:hypothetical protein
MGGTSPEQASLPAGLELGATAIIYRRGKPIGLYRVEDLSARGATLLGQREVERGKPLRVELTFSGEPPLSIAASAKLVQNDGMDIRLTVEFPHISAHESEVIDRSIASARRRSLAPGPAGVLVFERRSEVRRRLEEDIAALGRRARVASTPLDAIQVLNDPNEWIDTVIVEGGVEDPIGVELVEFFAKHQGLRTIVLEAPDQDPGTTARFAACAHAFLPACWDRWRLEQVLARG